MTKGPEDPTGAEVRNIRNTRPEGFPPLASSIPRAQDRSRSGGAVSCPPGNGIRLGPRTRRVIRSAARLVNPVVLRIAGRRPRGRGLPRAAVWSRAGGTCRRPYTSLRVTGQAGDPAAPRYELDTTVAV